MNWEAIGALGQMLGSLAVFITLGYLALQVHHARDSVRRTAKHARAEMVRQQFITLATDVRLQELLAKAQRVFEYPTNAFYDELVNHAGLTREEANRVSAMESAWWQVRTQAIRNMDVLPALERAEFDSRMRLNYREGTLSGLWYQTFKPNFDSDLSQYIDKVLLQPD